jgi:hypothetical protein
MLASRHVKDIMAVGKTCIGIILFLDVPEAIGR